jgi:chromosome segregation ATPase
MNTKETYDSLLNRIDLLKEIEHLQNALTRNDNIINGLSDKLYKANYKNRQALDEIAILNSTIVTLQSTIDSLCNDLQKSILIELRSDYWGN